MTKAWTEYDNSRTTLQPNWNREAKREKPQDPVPMPKAKIRHKQLKHHNKNKKQVFEEVVFVTPPVTPPPEKNTIQAKNNERDDEFWNFYEKA